MKDFRPEEKNVVYIGEGVSLTGSVKAQDTIVVDGAIDGEISCSQLIVGPSGVVNGTISVSDADIYGRIGTDITIKQLLIVRSTGRVEGKWIYGEIEVEKGGVLFGTAESTEIRSERKPAGPKDEKAGSFKRFEKPELVSSNEADAEAAPVTSISSRALRDRRKA
ncbi:polymer-forming cytoskeletal protein [Methylosinus sp. KRF6]|uniref:bactofilin family protein n=1 Tax=Methylosinus sp. KRF6 TaxID=2846853 RepID=UPI001C0D2E1B|nr:polymer-forming cytoskeletal protein [Methylosinus sp. KRF6]MBU3890469.1 polymer-forming cytoskeletal protein [Methylosinus sp. KRF6]